MIFNLSDCVALNTTYVTRARVVKSANKYVLKIDLVGSQHEVTFDSEHHALAEYKRLLDGINGRTIPASALHELNRRG